MFKYLLVLLLTIGLGLTRTAQYTADFNILGSIAPNDTAYIGMLDFTFDYPISTIDILFKGGVTEYVDIDFLLYYYEPDWTAGDTLIFLDVVTTSISNADSTTAGNYFPIFPRRKYKLYIVNKGVVPISNTKIRVIGR